MSPARPPAPAPSSVPGVPVAAPPDWRDLAANRDVLVSYLVPRCRDEHEAEDLSHETLLRAVRFRHNQVDPTRLRAWLLQIAANLHRDHVRRESRHWFVPIDDPVLDALEVRCPEGAPYAEGVIRVADREYAESELLAALGRAWRDLEPRERAVLEAYYREGGTADAAARAGAVSRHGVKVTLHRARKRLEERVGVALRAAEVERLMTRPKHVEWRALRS